MKKKIMTMAMMALAFTACTKEDLMPPTQGDAGTLHITSVTIDGQQVARTRVVADGGSYPDGIPFNQSITGFTEGDVLTLVTNGLSAGEAGTNQFYAIYNDDGTWTIANTQDGTNPVSLKPDRENGKKWADVSMSANFFSDTYLEGEDLLNKAKELGAVQGKAIATENIHLLTDYLAATTSLTNQDTQGSGSITINTDLKSPTLGAVTIQLKHTYRALLRLPKSAANIEEGTYIVNGTAHNVTGLGTLWAEVKYGSSTNYYPLTEVGDYLQAIVVADLPGQMLGKATLTGFKAVMLTEESGIVGSGSFDETKTLTLDLPFKKSASTTVSTSIYLLPNYRYPLTLNIAPHTASVTLTSPLGKPGWGTDEEELSNEMNEVVVIDGTATDVATVKAQIETALAAGKSTIYVTGETLAAYSNEEYYAQTVVGEAIYQLTKGTAIFLVLLEATSVPLYAFDGCFALTDVSLPAVQTIGSGAFEYCTSLKSVSAPNAISIENEAFMSCSALTSLTFGTVIEYVGTDAFENCSTENCNLTLNIDQLSSTYPVSTDENGKPTWAGYTWASISYVDNDDNAVEGN